ncbi:MAG: hypothetical protein V4555_11695 [Acidobacteriota bacterium]
MLDVHPPHEATHSWTDFFIHIATIVVGLILAVGLEQSVEAVHHHHQRRELEQALYADTEKAVRESAIAAADNQQLIHYLDVRIAQVEAALDSNHPPTALLPRPVITDYDSPDDPTWKAAKSSGLTELFSPDDIKAYSETDALVAINTNAYFAAVATWEKRTQFEWKFERNGATAPDFAHATRQNVEDYLDLLLAEKSAYTSYNAWTKFLHGAESSILSGERNLARIQQAER